jgi:hypothetical protein
MIDQITDLAWQHNITSPSIIKIYIATYPHHLTTPAFIISAVASLQPQCQHSLKYKNEFGGVEQDTTSFTLLHKKKNIKRPSCKSSLFHFDGRPFFSSAHIVNEIVVLHHSPCPSSIGNCGKALFFCLSCGSQSSHTSGRLQDKGCKCVRRNDNNNVTKGHPESNQTWEGGG